MSLLMKALKQAEKRHQHATAAALEQSAGESVADALATPAADEQPAPLVQSGPATGQPDAGDAGWPGHPPSVADAHEPGANDFAHLSLSIAEMSASSLTLEDADQLHARANPVPAPVAPPPPLPALLSGEPIGRRRAETAAPATLNPAAPASRDLPAASMPPAASTPDANAAPLDHGVAGARKPAAPDRSRLYLWSATGTAMLGIGGWLAWQLFAPVGSPPGASHALPPMAMATPQTGESGAQAAAVPGAVASLPPPSEPADAPSQSAVAAPVAVSPAASMPITSKPVASVSPAAPAVSTALAVPAVPAAPATPAAPAALAAPAARPRQQDAAPGATAPAIDLAGTALVGEPPRLVPSRPTAATAPARTDESPRQAGVRLVRADNGEQVGRLLDTGYAALSASDHPAAQSAYEKVIALDANNGDAFVGLATLHARAGRTAQAERAYNRALEIDPNDSAARAGLVALRGGGDLAAQESQFRHMLAQDDSQPPVHYALGNVLATQGRWAEAQQSYFNASAGDPDQPDYAYNLAISLERLKQPRAAATHYRRAIELAARRPARFPMDTARARVMALDAAGRPPADKAD